jgi:hypothetical protein
MSFTGGLWGTESNSGISGIAGVCLGRPGRGLKWKIRMGTIQSFRWSGRVPDSGMPGYQERWGYQFRHTYYENFNPRSNTEAQIKIFVKRQLWPSLMSIKLYEMAPGNSVNRRSCLQYQPEMTESLFWQDATNFIWVLFPRRWGSKTRYEGDMKNWIHSMSSYEMKPANQNSVWEDVPTNSYSTRCAFASLRR